MSRQVVRQYACRALGPRAFLLAPLALAVAAAQAEPLPGGDLNPLLIPKYVTPLVIPPVMKDNGVANDFDIAVRQFQQQILPGGIWNTLNGRNDQFPATTVWSYGPEADPTPAVAPSANSQFNYPAYTVEARKDVPIKVDWINGLVANPDVCKTSGTPDTDPACNFLPHILAVDRSLHWANPEGLPCIEPDRVKDCAPDPAKLPDPTLLKKPYNGPVPMVPHLHGSHATPESDGYAEAWWLPAANDIDCRDAPTYPATPDLTDDYWCTGTLVNQFGVKTNATPGAGSFKYLNDQPAATFWYHDHSLGMTRNNVYAGPAGFYILRDPAALGGETGLVSGVLPGPAPVADQAVLDLNIPGNPIRAAVREIPIVIQDRSFNADGSLFYPDNRAFFEGLTPDQLQIPFIGDLTTPSDIAAIWNPEAFFNTMVVNGVSWPSLEVEPDLYRFRLLNGCNSRFLNLALFEVTGSGTDGIFGTADDTLGAEVPFYQIGAEQSLLPKVVEVKTGFKTPLPGDGNIPTPVAVAATEEALLMGSAERADVIVDFSGLAPGTRIRMINTAPDAPFGGFVGDPAADPDTSGQVMEFTVLVDDPAVGEGFTPPASLVLSPVENVTNYPAGLPNVVAQPRDQALLEEESVLICVTFDAVAGTIVYDPTAVPNPADPATCVLRDTTTLAESLPFGPKAAVLGINGASRTPTITLWSDPIQTNPQFDAAGNPPTETWEFWNHTVDAHPIHVHEVKFKVLNREAFDPATGALVPNTLRSPEATEAGWKDTVIAYPSDVTRIVATFDLPGLYVWHCHIVEHEDNEMMVPYCIGNKDPALGPVAPGCILNEPPEVTDDAYSTNQDTALTVPAPGVLANDKDINANNILTALLVTGPANGTLSLHPDGSFTYTPNLNFNGSDAFTYKANDGVLDSVATATVTITVTPVNDPPVAVNDAYTTAEDTTLTIDAPGVLVNDTDVEGGVLTAVLVSGPTNGTVVLGPNGGFVYTPNVNFTGSDSFTYLVSDGTLISNQATVTITVTAVNDAPVAGNDAYSVLRDTPLTISEPGVLTNDSDVDGDSLTAALLDSPTHGTVVLSSDGAFAYTPSAGYVGPDSFTYWAVDGTTISNEATVTITVNPHNPQMYLSLAKARQTLVGLGPNGSDLPYTDEDILSWNGTNYALVFDGSAAGLSPTADIVAFDMDPANNRILMAFGADQTIPGVGLVTGADIVAYALGSGTFSLFFDGSDVSLVNPSEYLDALEVLADGRLIVSTVGDASVPSGGISIVASDQDLLVFKPTSLGDLTKGTWSYYFDGSDVLLRNAIEGVDAVAVADTGAIYLSTRGNFAVPGVTGQNEDVFVCNPSLLGNKTACTFAPFFDGTAHGLGPENVDAIDLP